MPSIYVASLSDYNNAILHGTWIDLDDYDSLAEVHNQIATMLAASPTAKAEGCPAEEWAIHDYEDFGEFKVNEYESLETLWHFKELCADMDEDTLEAFSEFLADQWNGLEDIDKEAIEKFNDAYCGRYDDEEDFAEQLAEDTGLLHCIPQHLHCYFDFERFGRDLFIDDYWMSDSGHVFRRY